MDKQNKILLIEDNPGDVRLINEVLMQCTPLPQLEVKKDGEQAFKYFESLSKDESSAKPDIIIMDLNLPLRDGYELLYHIKTNSKLKSIPVIIFSSSEAQKDIKQCYAWQANSYIVKPFDFNEFSRVIKGIYDFWFKIARQPLL